MYAGPDNRTSMIRKKRNKEKKLLQAKRKKLQAEERERERRGKLLAVKPRSKEFVEYHPSENRYARNDGNKSIPSKPLSDPKPRTRTEIYTDEMLLRDRAAKAEAERRKQMCVPLYNKGPVQYIGTDVDPEIIKGLGRKL